ncbi:MAG: AEC family transporter, partial [Gammaproteobacteria bacterium]|nr:AEC family transporter [Gammaproteobacteria bacterium]
MNYLQALLPTFLLIFTGLALRHQQWVKTPAWKRIESLTYFVLLPLLLFSGLARANFQALENTSQLALAIFFAICLMGLFLLLIRPLCRVDGPAFSSVYQGSIRPNIYIAISVATSLYGEQGVILASLIIAVMLPLGNVLSVLVLGYFADEDRSIGKTLRALVTNPIIIACALGMGFNLAAIPLSSTLLDGFAYLGQAALPLGLMAVGAGLKLNTGDQWHHYTVMFTSGFKLLLFPSITALVCYSMGLQATATTVAVLFTAVPCSASAYVLSGQMGGHQPLMSLIISTQTMLAVFSLPFILWFAS